MSNGATVDIPPELFERLGRGDSFIRAAFVLFKHTGVRTRWPNVPSGRGPESPQKALMVLTTKRLLFLVPPKAPPPSLRLFYFLPLLNLVAMFLFGYFPPLSQSQEFELREIEGLNDWGACYLKIGWESWECHLLEDARSSKFASANDQHAQFEAIEAAWKAAQETVEAEPET
jgi:hypothetical protein